MLHQIQGLDIKVSLAIKCYAQGHYTPCTNNVILLLKANFKALSAK